MLSDLTSDDRPALSLRLWDAVTRFGAGGAMALLAAGAYSVFYGILVRGGGAMPAPLTAARLVASACLFVLLVIQATLIFSRPMPRAKAKGVQPRLMALLGTWLIALVLAIPAPEAPLPALDFAAAVLAALSDAVAIVVMFNLGRSFSVMAEARDLVTTGAYALVRHPLYLAEELGLLSAVLTRWSALALAILAVQLFCQWQRARNEERVLGRVFPDYAAYRARVPMLIPVCFAGSR